jgi:hypothetical protein
MTEIGDNLSCLIVCGMLSLGGTIAIVSWHSHLSTVDTNSHNAKIEMIKIENRRQIELTKQKSIEKDKARKRKIWERAMPEKAQKAENE